MSTKQIGRRAFLKTSGGFVAGGATLSASSISRAQHAEGPAETSNASLPGAKQSNDGVVYSERSRPSDVGHGFPPPKEKRVTIHNWTDTADTIRWTFSNADLVFKSTPIEKGDVPVWLLPRRMLDPDKLAQAEVLWGTARDKAEKIPVAEWLKRSETDALVVLHDGHIVAEQYIGNVTPHTRRFLASGSKSVLATIVAPFLRDQTLDEQALATKYVPEFLGTAFEGATLRHLLDQTSGVYVLQLHPFSKQFQELTPEQQKEWAFGSPEQRRANHGFAQNMRAMGMYAGLPNEKIVGYYDYILGLERKRQHGECFYYMDTNVIAMQWILERATGVPYAEHVANLWQELGPEHIATLGVDNIGIPLGGTGLSTTARDWARWGQMVCSRGQVGSGRVLPRISEFVDDIQRNPGPERWTEKTNYLGVRPPNSGYRSFSWTMPVVPGKNPIFFAAGACQQYCFIDPQRNNVVVRFASFPLTLPSKEQSQYTILHDNTAIYSFIEDVLPQLTE